MSLRVVLTHYLESLRERNELDALLPEIVVAMGHSVISRPQVGVAQGGVDLVSVFAPDGVHREIHLWILKFGDVGRADMLAGVQAIDPSVREACVTFVPHRLDAHLRALPIHIVVVSNGELRQEARDAWTGLVDQIRTQHGHDVEFWGMDQLTPLIETHLFDEGLLLGSAKGHLHAALAGLDETETSVRRFIRFVNQCVTPPGAGGSRGAAAREQDFLRRCGAAAMGYGILLVWGRAESNLKPGVICGEYLLLRLWSSAVEAGRQGDEAVLTRLQAIATLHVHALNDYFEKVGPTLLSRRQLTRYRWNHVFYAQLLFEELGRLSTLLLLMQHLAAPRDVRQQLRDILISLFNSHVALLRPVLDDQSIDLSLLFAALLGEGDGANVAQIVRGLVLTLRRTLDTPDFLPVDSDLLEDAIAAQINHDVEPRTFFELSTLIPMLGCVAALLGEESLLTDLRALAPRLEDVSLEQWWPTAALETFTGGPGDLNSVGVSRLLAGFRASAEEQAAIDRTPPEGAPYADAFCWHGSSWEVLVALSARLHRHPVPTWFLAQAARGWAAPDDANGHAAGDPPADDWRAPPVPAA
ncbi:MAG: hypothetical protein ACT4NL_02395 [Pseudomarimonas sp.]